MISIVDSIRSYFSKKANDQKTPLVPEGTCPTCWGRNEWDGQFYEIIKDKHAQPGSATYDSFISKVVDEHVRTTHQLKNKYVCVTCDKDI